jgi:hemoglobin-like flavoprotein
MQSHDMIFEANFTRLIGPGPAITPAGQRFFAEFYERFTARSEEVKRIFSKTDMPRQSNMLLKSVHYLVGMYATGTVSDHIVKIAEKHSALELDIPPALYDEWMEALIETVEAEVPEFDEEVALAWRFAFAPGLAVMRHYSAINSRKPILD